MSETKIAGRYANSLYQKAKEVNLLDSIASDIRNLNTLVLESAEFNTFINSPLISKTTKKSSLNKIFTSFNKETLALFNLMAEKSRENLIAIMGIEFIKIYNANNGITSAEVTSATDVDKDTLDKIEQFIKSKTGAKTVQMTIKTNSQLIEGMMIMFDGKIYDSSILTQLRKIKKELKIA